MGISWKGIIIVALVLLPNILFAIFPPNNILANIEDGGMVINILEHGTQIIYFIVLVSTTKNSKVNYGSILFIGMVICLLVYYILWVRYFINGREYSLLFDTVMHIPLPMAVFPILFLLFAALWFQNISLTILIGLFAVGHIINSYTTYKQLL
ncbi:hypothetical protein [Clostridium sp. CF012]|uniref:hypothetical protein n=1 Tax=Clostridium sp. CF012 TaxID=2843319 RepID=UPI001C0AB57E|nr:hypothetical protein [Clostridium sp. CF012]MBU3146929.1 hypothetical protein [Clostridium sp. CF012]